MTKKELMMMVNMMQGCSHRDKARYLNEVSARIDALVESVPVPDRQTCNAYYCAIFAQWKESQK